MNTTTKNGLIRGLLAGTAGPFIARFAGLTPSEGKYWWLALGITAGLLSIVPNWGD
jgi:hypothetical protein